MDYENIYYTCNFPKKDIPLGKYNARNYRAEGASDDAHNVNEFYLDLSRVEGNKLFFVKGYEERD